MSRRLRLLVATASVAAVAGAAVPAGASAAPVITASGSTSVAPLSALLAKGYLKQYPGRVKFRLAQGGSDVGVADVAAGRVTIGNSSRDPKASDPGGIFFNKIAKDAICIVTNPANPLVEPVPGQIKGIFSGQVRNWEDVPGRRRDRLDQPRRPHRGVGHPGRLPEDLHGLEATCQRRRPEGLQRSRRSRPSSPTRTPSATCRWTSSRAPAPRPTRASACNLRNAKSGQYGGVRNFWMVTRGRARGRRCRSSSTGSQNTSGGQKIVAHALGAAEVAMLAGCRAAVDRPARRANARRAGVVGAAC